MSRRTNVRFGTIALPLLLACISGATCAQDSAPKRGPVADPTADPMLLSAGFLSGHPDLRYRLLGLDEYKKGKLEDAFRFFKRAAYYADKPSQAMVAEMLWTGQGVAVDKASAYGWMDLAAERGYASFLGQRERYWMALDESERERALAEGQAIYSKYGDAAAQPRLETAMRRNRNQMTGSRTGYTGGNLRIYVEGPSGVEEIDGSKFYDPKYWDPAKYRAWHDAVWMKPYIGRVQVGDPEKMKEGDAVVPSRVPASEPQVDASEPETPEKDESQIGTQEPG